MSRKELGSYALGQGHNQVKGQIVPKIVLHVHKLLKQIWWNFTER